MAEQPSSTQPSRHHGWPGREETGLHRKKEEGAGLIPKNAEGDSATVTADAHLELLQIWLRDLEPYSNYRQRQTNSTPTVRWLRRLRPGLDVSGYCRYLWRPVY
jgi:hypothetical protein